MLFLAAISASRIDFFHPVAADQNNEEDFEEESSIQICCTWGEDLQDGILRYYIDNDNSSKEQQEAVGML